MKKFFIMAACLVAMATTASAQFMGGGSASSSSSSDGEGYTSIRLHYNNFEIEPKEGSFDAVPSFGISLVKGWAISQDMPLFLEAGVGASYTSGELIKNQYGKSEYSAISAEIPVNIGYKFQINDEFAIMPFVGVSARYNITGKTKDKANDGGGYDYDDDYYYGGYYAKAGYDYGYDDDYDYGYGYDDENEGADDDDEGADDDDDVKKFQFGWQIGARAMYNQFSVGVSYGADFNEISDDCKAKSLIISVGYNF